MDKEDIARSRTKLGGGLNTDFTEEKCGGGGRI